MQPTRWEILQLLKRRGRATVQELSKALGMTLMGVRLHLVVVERDGYVKRSTVREKPGRPALVYSLTPRAEDLFPKRYDQLVEKLLEVVDGPAGRGGLGGVIHATAHAMALPYLPRLGGRLSARVEETAAVLNEMGCYASYEPTAGGYLLHECNCPYYRVALRNRALCSMDQLFLAELLGVAPQLRECLLDGAGRCTHFVPAG